ncbi:MAG: hypothetical protein HQM04_11570 [Magnetococcales bacterium]|nr:hypothetical protein [Magnetococcales bacterium]
MSRWDTLSGLANRSCLATFGTPVAYRPALRNQPDLAEQSFPITGIFTEKNLSVTLMGAGANGLDAVVPQPTLEIRLSDLGFLPMTGDEVTVDGLLYQVVEVQPDGRGMALLRLARQPDPSTGL